MNERIECSRTLYDLSYVFAFIIICAGFASATQSNATFENLATQNTLTFGNLAQQSVPQPAAPSFNT